MAILAYLFLAGITCIPVLIITLILFIKKKFHKLLFFICLVPLVYMLICTIYFMATTGQNQFRNKPNILYAEQDFLLGVDRIYLYKDQTFYIEYADHNYYGTYILRNQNINLVIESNFFSPLRSTFPNNLVIIENKIIDPKTQDLLFYLH